MQFKKGPSDRRIPEFDQADTMNQNESRSPSGESRFSFSRSPQQEAPPEAGEEQPMDDGGSAPAVSSRIESLLDASSSVEGHFIAEQDLRIQGNISGEVTCRGLLTVEQHATVSATVNGRDAEILGSVEGDITCTGRLRLASTAVMNGTIRAGSLVVEEGAAIHGPVETQFSGEATSSSGSSSSGANRSRSSSSSSSRRSEKNRDADDEADDESSNGGRRARDLPSFALVSSEEGSNTAPRNASS